MSEAAYDRIGRSYERHRRADPRIAARLAAALGDARSLLNVGAGAGSYEPRHLPVVGVEPSRVMLAQRPATAAPAVRAVAEALPFRDASFDAAMAILTVHHWTDHRVGLHELCRVARRRVLVLTWDAAVAASTFWLTRDYVTGVPEAERDLATLTHVASALLRCTVQTIPVPWDCSDGFLGAYWRRPEAYLDPGVRGAISGLTKLGEGRVAPAIARLADDLASGAWESRYGALRRLGELDLGYRLVVAERVLV